VPRLTADAVAPQHYNLCRTLLQCLTEHLTDAASKPWQNAAFEIRRNVTTRLTRPVSRLSCHSSLYLSEPVYEALRRIAFEERVKIHDVVLEGIDAALRRRGYPSIESLKAGRRR
jgi:hypothetical protein